MAIAGYSDQLSVQPGQKVQFMVNCDGPDRYRADIVRLIHGDTNPEGPGYKEELVQTEANREYPGRRQEIHAGSYVIVPDHPLLQGLHSFTVQAMIWPTTPAKGVQGLVTKWAAAQDAGFGLFIDDDGCAAVWIGDGHGDVTRLSSGKPLLPRCWYFAGASFDAGSGRLRLYQEPFVATTNGRFSLPYDLEATTAAAERTSDVVPFFDNGAPLIMAGYLEGMERDRPVVGGLYNGKLDRPRLAGAALGHERMALMVEAPQGMDLVAAWDFAQGIGPGGIPSSRVVDVSPNRLHGETLNQPARAMTGYNWTSVEQRFVNAPQEYGAIHFHDDDLDDARWEVDFDLTIPEGLRSGLYAARLRAPETDGGDEGQDEDYVPFYVRPRRGTATAKIAFLAPTAAYMAYANDHLQTNVPSAQTLIARGPVMQTTDLFLAGHREYGLSTYDTHSDGSGVCYSSRLRPMLNMRPKYRHWLSPSLWQFNADLHLIDWLTEMGHDFDVVTDQDLNFEGVELLKPYNVVLTGSHPEYYSGAMLDATQAYQQGGGKFMYMGANGFYWVIAFHPENPNVIEVRKWGGSQAWRAQPGEYYLGFTGELGGLWRNRGRAPQKLCGTGFVAEGFDVSSYYRRRPDSMDPRASWIFDGVGEDELIGDFGLVGGGAAGLELDIYDTELGTPEHALLLASSEGHTDIYLEVVEELFFNIPGLGGTQNPRVRADMVYYPTPNGGAVFSVSSIAWCGSLSHNNYANNVSRITNNVLTRFASGEPLKW